jgi:hypothetical protein
MFAVLFESIQYSFLRQNKKVEQNSQEEFTVSSKCTKKLGDLTRIYKICHL